LQHAICNVLEGKPLEKQLESRATGSQPGSIMALCRRLFLHRAGDGTRQPGDGDSDGYISIQQGQGKVSRNLNVLGIAYKPDGTIGARFSRYRQPGLGEDEWKELPSRRIAMRTNSMPHRAPTNLQCPERRRRCLRQTGIAARIDAYDGKQFI